MSLFRRGTTRGVLATALASWCTAIAPMIKSVYDLQSSGDRSTQMFAVIFVGVIAVPISLFLATGFIPAHGVLRRLESSAPWGYLVWGVILLTIAAVLVGMANPSATVEPQDYPILMLIIVGGGAGLGFVFWLTAVKLP